MYVPVIDFGFPSNVRLLPIPLSEIMNHPTLGIWQDMSVWWEG